MIVYQVTGKQSNLRGKYSINILVGNKHLQDDS